jgi:hypothetical protein
MWVQLPYRAFGAHRARGRGRADTTVVRFGCCPRLQGPQHLASRVADLAADRNCLLHFGRVRAQRGVPLRPRGALVEPSGEAAGAVPTGIRSRAGPRPGNGRNALAGAGARRLGATWVVPKAGRPRAVAPGTVCALGLNSPVVLPPDDLDPRNARCFRDQNLLLELLS